MSKRSNNRVLAMVYFCDTTMYFHISYCGMKHRVVVSLDKSSIGSRSGKNG